MGFFETLRRVLSGTDTDTDTSEGHRSPGGASSQPHDDLPVGSSDIPADSEATTPGPDIYDRLQWHKKLKRVLDTLPDSRAEWPDLIADARALGFDSEWVLSCQIEEFKMLVRRAVSDRHFTEDEHRKLDLARDLIGLPESKAEAILHAIIAEAEAFFGKPVEGS
jgi:hypothetical protein